MGARLALAALACFALGSPALSAGFFGGVSVGEGRIEGESLAATYDLDDRGWAAYVGYRWLEYVAVEGRYADLGSSADVIGGLAVGASARSAGASGYGILPVSPRLDLFARAGVAWWDLDFSAAGQPLDDDGADLSFGGGMAYRFSPRVGMRVEWERYELGESGSASLTSLGVHFGF